MKNCKNFTCGGSNAVYGMGFLGVLVYYLQHAASFQAGLTGFVKALFWPAFLLYKIVEMWQI